LPFVKKKISLGLENGIIIHRGHLEIIARVPIGTNAHKCHIMPTSDVATNVLNHGAEPIVKSRADRTHLEVERENDLSVDLSRKSPCVGKSLKLKNQDRRKGSQKTLLG
jgi:hypothetical protein